MRVKDLAQFERIHASVEKAHRKFGITELVCHDCADRLNLTLIIRGQADAINKWLASPEREALAKDLELEAPATSWIAEELFPEGVYRRDGQ
jgi:antibiotic biosynthesis monooxygenase (ABM) superfamily enzyme